MRYSVLILLFVVLICINAVGMASAQSLVSISPSTQQVDEAQDFTISVYVEPDLPISGAAFDLQFDSSLVSVVSITEGDLFNQGGSSTFFNPGTIDNSQGTVTNV